MKEFAYQQTAVDGLTAKVIKQLNVGKPRRKIVFKAPTGSGKTVMACQVLSNVIDSLKSDTTNRYEEVAFIWFAPRKLHIQSFLKLKDAYSDGRELRPVMYDDLDQSTGIQPGEILFVNWESVNKDKNIIVRESESNKSLYEICRKTREELGLPIVAIIDEEHMFWSKSADKSAAVLDRINPDVELRISATPKTMRYDEIEHVSRQDVIEAGMIKREVVLNPDIESGISDETTVMNHLIAKALEKRQQLADAYQMLGIKINPLLLIQLPNDTKETMTAEDNDVATFVKQYLQVMEDITEDNGKLAVWLSSEKRNLENLEVPDNLAQVLLFKEAIALGWDCPRAAVLLIFRKLQSDEFTVQTVGRILRMPEHHHYTDERLNLGYVYTDIAKEKINIVTADADYIKKSPIVAYRRDNLNNVSLPSVYSERPNDARNYFGPDFRKVLYQESEKFWDILKMENSLFSFADLAALRGDDIPAQPKLTEDEQIAENRRRVANRLRLDAANIKVQLANNVHFQNGVQTLDVESKVRLAQTETEINRAFIAFIAGYLGGFESKNNPVDKLAGYLLESLADFFGLFDTDAKKVVLYHENKLKFDRLLRLAIDKYLEIRQIKKIQASRKNMKEWDWEVPAERCYDEDSHHTHNAKNHALKPFVELNKASNPEKEFTKFLEDNTMYIDWWYKNGDSGRQNYAVKYTLKDGSVHPFYVDFVIRMKNGHIYLFDTKSIGSDVFAVEKHNALLEYMRDNSTDKQPLMGGVIVKQGLNWLYSPLRIENTTDTLNWSAFYPQNA